MIRQISEQHNKMADRRGVIKIKDDSHFLVELERAGNKLVIVDFFATWCGPCRFIAPYFETYSQTYKNAVFLKVDVDICQESAITYEITAMPTFCFLKNKQKLGTVRGANPTELESAIKKWLEEVHTDRDEATLSLGRNFDCFVEVTKNATETFLDASELLIKFASNVLKDPGNEKYRSVRLGNKIFQNRLLPVPGAVECLFQMGFEEEDDKLVLPSTCSLDNLKALRDALSDERETLTHLNAPLDKTTPVIASTPSRRWLPFLRNPSERSFYERLKSTSNHVFIYEDPKMIRFALSKIPFDRMRNEAQMKSSETKSADGKVEVDDRDYLLLLLLDWFKNKFFKWMDRPTCDICNIPTQNIGHAKPTDDDLRWGAGVVENYRCQNCSRNYTFPRYNHPQKLLETRRGRCGEWANCFTMCCRAAGFEARYILDWTDHVWTEVYSERQKRWLHCDPCENVCDKPLLYEAGWGKKLTYVIAFSKDEVIDVTWRYTEKQKEVLQRRQEVSESWLVDLWMNMSKELQDSCTEARQRTLKERNISELIEFLASKSASDDEKIGRQSGSLAWRRIRGETGPSAGTKNQNEGYVFSPTDNELEHGSLRIRYCTASDKYFRGINKEQVDLPSLEGWANGVESCENIFRKVENDWKMVYLARKESKDLGRIVWRIRIEKPNYAIETIKVKACSTTFENGVITWHLSCDEKKLIEDIPSNNDNVHTSTKFHGVTDLRLTACLSGGDKEISWQHTQLFRQKLENTDDYPLDVTVYFTRK